MERRFWRGHEVLIRVAPAIVSVLGGKTTGWSVALGTLTWECLAHGSNLELDGLLARAAGVDRLYGDGEGAGAARDAVNDAGGGV